MNNLNLFCPNKANKKLSHLCLVLSIPLHWIGNFLAVVIIRVLFLAVPFQHSFPFQLGLNFGPFFGFSPFLPSEFFVQLSNGLKHTNAFIKCKIVREDRKNASSNPGLRGCPLSPIYWLLK